MYSYFFSDMHSLNGRGQDVVTLSVDTVLDSKTLDHMYA